MPLYTIKSIAQIWQQTRYALRAVRGLSAKATPTSSAPDVEILRLEGATSAATRAFHTSAKNAGSSDLKGVDMGQIVAEYDLMPASTEIDLKKVIAALPDKMPKGVRIIEHKIVPVAFGLMKVKVGLVIDDSDESIGSKVEDALRSIEGIDNVECVSNTVL